LQFRPFVVFLFPSHSYPHGASWRFGGFSLRWTVRSFFLQISRSFYQKVFLKPPPPLNFGLAQQLLYCRPKSLMTVIFSLFFPVSSPTVVWSCAYLAWSCQHLFFSPLPWLDAPPSFDFFNLRKAVIFFFLLQGPVVLFHMLLPSFSLGRPSTRLSCD